MKILDSDHCIAILRGQLDLRQRISADDVLAVTALSVGELTLGAHKSLQPEENLSKLEVLLAALLILPFDGGAARQFGYLKARLEEAVNPLSDLDLQIASVALEHDIPLLTHNRKHFERVPGLVLDDWSY